MAKKATGEQAVTLTYACRNCSKRFRVEGALVKDALEAIASSEFARTTHHCNGAKTTFAVADLVVMQTTGT